MRLWVFSDLHLTHPDTALYQSFLKALEEPQSSFDSVVFAGDIFEVFVGHSEYFLEKHAAFFACLKLLSDRQVNLFYIEGNHDFHLRDAFAGLSIRFESEAVMIEAQASMRKRKIYIAHGDLVDESDAGYLLLRKFFRSKFTSLIIDRLPGQWIERLGEKIARPHDQKSSDLPEQWGQEAQKKLRTIYRNFAQKKHEAGFDYVILGHCHDFDEIQPFYFNMGYPPVHQTYLFYDSTDDCVIRKSLRK